MTRRKRQVVVVVTLFVALFGIMANAISSDFMWGNLILNRTIEKMEKANVNPVIYPHWLHRTWFRCKVCHLDIVIDKQGANEIDMKKIEEGKVCGTCHNGKLAFGVKDNCKRCHSLTSDGTVDGPVFSTDNIEDKENPGESIMVITASGSNETADKEFRKIAKRVGAKWSPEVMGTRGLPKDRFGFIDWIKMVDDGVVKPIHSLNPEDEDVRRDTGVLFNVLSDFEDNVLFSHNLHSYWMKCEMCHDKIFKAELGANKVRMKDMVISQNFCVHCHGKVSFPAASCTNCHKREKGKPVVEEGEDNILDRHEKESAVVIIQ